MVLKTILAMSIRNCTSPFLQKSSLFGDFCPHIWPPFSISHLNPHNIPFKSLCVCYPHFRNIELQSLFWAAWFNAEDGFRNFDWGKLKNNCPSLSMLNKILPAFLTLGGTGVHCSTKNPHRACRCCHLLPLLPTASVSSAGTDREVLWHSHLQRVLIPGRFSGHTGGTQKGMKLAWRAAVTSLFTQSPSWRRGGLRTRVQGMYQLGDEGSSVTVGCLN